jgi:hypothetical protein
VFLSSGDRNIIKIPYRGPLKLYNLIYKSECEWVCVLLGSGGVFFGVRPASYRRGGQLPFCSQPARATPGISARYIQNSKRQLKETPSQIGFQPKAPLQMNSFGMSFQEMCHGPMLAREPEVEKHCFRCLWRLHHLGSSSLTHENCDDIWIHYSQSLSRSGNSFIYRAQIRNMNL